MDNSKATDQPWAYDSHHNELDPQLQAAQQEALRQHISGSEFQEAEQTEPMLLRGLLSEEQIDEILKEAAVPGAWPRGVGKDKNNEPDTSAADGCTVNCELQSVAHHYAWTQGHVVLYMHEAFIQKHPEQWSRIRGGMESRPWMEGAIPEIEPGFEDDAGGGMELVRCIELHHYANGGGLTTPDHRDNGSELTISVLLSDPDDVSGGDFVTYDKGIPVAHKMERGDAILFNSHKLHNIATLTGGVRQSLVVELWPSNPDFRMVSR